MQITIGNYRFAPGLYPSLFFAMILPILMSLGFWQLDRAHEKKQLLAHEATGVEASIVDLTRSAVLTLKDRFAPAKVVGEFDSKQQWLLDNRIRNRAVGYHVFSRLKVDGAPDILVNRGWVSVGASREFLPKLPLPNGKVTLVGRLDTPGSVGLKLAVDLDSPTDRLLVQHLDIAALARKRQWQLQPLTLVLNEGSPDSFAYDWIPVKSLGPEKHLGYAVQWFALSLALLVIYISVNTKRRNEEVKDVDV